MTSAISSRTMPGSPYYLERVGFETYIRLRLNLRNGPNSIGRFDRIEKNDFIIHSKHCSALHCIITVSEDSAVIENMSKTTGTFINRMKMTDKIVELKENDTISIVPPKSIDYDFTGDYSVYVYRLRKYSSEQPLTIEIDDDEAYVLSDDDEPNGVIILDPVDKQAEHDLGIQLSREFNAEIKQELQDIDEFETYCKEVKMEPSNFFEIETSDADLNQEPRSSSNGSGETLIVSPHREEDNPNCTGHVTSIVDGNSNILDETPVEGDKLDKLENEISKVDDKSQSEKSPKLIKAKQMQNQDKKKESKATDPEAKKERKAKHRRASASETRKSSNAKEKVIASAKVKYTKDNRGAFLTDPTQMPGLPASVKERRKSTMTASLPKPPPQLPSTSAYTENDANDTEIDELLSKLIKESDYSNFKIKKLSFSDLRKPETIETDCPTDNLTIESNASPEATGSNVIFNDSPTSKVMKVSTGDHVSTENYNTLSNSTIEECELKHKSPVQASRFQINPCHEIISILTAYDSEQFKSVDVFCSSIDTNYEPFKDTFMHYEEYMGTILPLILLELWKEIELEYTNSEVNNFITVAVTDKNLEKRGDGRRMVIHCQVNLLHKSQSLSEGHILFVRSEYNFKKFEFLAVITSIAYVKKTEDLRFAHFTMETSAITETLPVDSLDIRAITVISNTLNAFRSVYSLDTSPLLNLLLNPLSGQLPTNFYAGDIVYKGYDVLDANQTSIINAIYKQCINLNVPNISLLDGAAGTGKTCMISNLALQLVYGEGLSKPLRILICSRSNRNIDEITKKLLYVRNKSSTVQKIQLVRYGLLDQIDKACRCVSVQYMRENEQRFLQLANIKKLEKEKKILELKIRALVLDDDNDNVMELKLWRSKHIKVKTLIGRLAAIEKSKMKDPTTILLNACDIICTTLGSIPKLQNFIPSVDVCIIDEATQCNESLTLLPFGFGMPSLVLVGDSRLPPPMVYSPVAHKKNYGKSLFSRFQKLFSGRAGSPIYRINVQHRMHPEILKWPNRYFYDNELHPVASKSANSFPIAPYKMISYGPVQMEIDNLMLIVNVLLTNIDRNQYSIGIICTDLKLKSIIHNKLVEQFHQFIAVHSADEPHMNEKDVIITWISKEYGMRHLCDYAVFNKVVTRARQCLIICGADLLTYKSRPIFKSIQKDAQDRKCFHQMKNLLQPKLVNVLRKKI